MTEIRVERCVRAQQFVGSCSYRMWCVRNEWINENILIVEICPRRGWSAEVKGIQKTIEICRRSQRQIRHCFQMSKLVLVSLE